MQLTDMKYQESRSRKEIEAFGGLDRTDGAGDGYLTETEGLSSRRYPFLAPMEGRQSVRECEAGTALFAWGGLVVVDGTTLYYKDQAVGTVTPGEKQFAVVNTKLVIWPDKVYLDLESGELKALEATAALTAAGLTDNIVITENTLSAVQYPPVKEAASLGSYGGGADVWNPLVYTYGKDPEAVRACWDAEAGAWDLDKLAELETLSGFFSSAGATESIGYQPGRIVIPKGDSLGGLSYADGRYVISGTNAGLAELPDRSLYNTGGWYAVLTHLPEETSIASGLENGVIGTADSGGSYIKWAVDVYQVGTVNPAFTTLFTVGDALTVTGTPWGAQDAERRVISAIDKGTNTLTFPDGTFGEAPVAGITVTERLARNGVYYLKYGTTYWTITPTEPVEAGTALLLFQTDGAYSLKAWDQEEHTVLQTLALTGWSPTSAQLAAASVMTLTAYDLSGMVVKREVPDLDYICESGNRLWGVSNADKTIYASSLGLPERFYDYAGVSTDSYAVAVGSDGDWSGILDYSGSVLCWKEDVLHRVAGDYPATYYVYTDSYDGVEIGSRRSMRILNEVLYYKGRRGVYAYTGGQPTLISEKLGRARYTDAAAGACDGKYYISMKNTDGESELFVYDTLYGTWYREDGSDVTDFAALGGKLYGLIGNTVYQMDGGPVDDVEWSGTLAECTEQSCQKRMYRWLRVGAELGAGAWLRVEIAVDGKPKELVWQTGEAGRRQLNLPLRGMRAERMTVTLSGRGDVVIRYIARDFIELSEEW